jgi:hypothetical protein
MGLPEQYERTKEGPRITTDEAALRALRTRAPETIDTLLAVRKTAKMRSVYATIELGRGGCVHPSYLPVRRTDAGAAATGRLASGSEHPESAGRGLPPSHRMTCTSSKRTTVRSSRIAAALLGIRLHRGSNNGDVHAATMDLVGVIEHALKPLVRPALRRRASQTRFSPQTARPRITEAEARATRPWQLHTPAYGHGVRASS